MGQIESARANQFAWDRCRRNGAKRGSEIETGPIRWRWRRNWRDYSAPPKIAINNNGSIAETRTLNKNWSTSTPLVNIILTCLSPTGCIWIMIILSYPNIRVTRGCRNFYLCPSIIMDLIVTWNIINSRKLHIEGTSAAVMYAAKIDRRSTRIPFPQQLNI